ncbi:hypothetical protein IFT73_02510 [Aeromicrobium sp. CFBP 8757]|uniref:protealysin inhibitor emfourin n=1 Tax=Aeromicrobium sp. CFBP 8757 TaxID=2775288 RepID=UPI00177DA54F|nr:protealysin inhibitor emfourin [Aeromicrobium sp. CFBP 8757]MBD8605716.1 hypothetical protein [Aeromicrobium sp. CFBP 8757]
MDELPFVITVARTGGFAGLRREWSIEVSAPHEAEHWRPIVEACPWDTTTASGAAPDGFVYDLRVAGHEAVVAERELEGPWRQLVDEVRRSAEA